MLLVFRVLLHRKFLAWSKGPFALQTMLLLLLSAVGPRGVRGSDDGDPAPGRSPGPPIGYKIAGTPHVLSNFSSWCRNRFSASNSPRLNVSLQHPLYDVLRTLLPGLLYQVSVWPANSEPVREIYVLSTSKGHQFGSWKNGSPSRLCSDGNWVAVDRIEALQWSFLAPESTNVSFRFRYRTTSGEIQEENFIYSTATDCDLRLRHTKGHFGSFDLPLVNSCRVTFPRKTVESSDHKDGLLVELTRLNVPCAGGGFIQFVGGAGNFDERSSAASKKLCGKLEELNPVERKLYFPSLSEVNRPFLVVRGNPIFSLSYHLVDYCYNVTLVTRNGSLVLNPVENLLCHFRIHLPYGNRVLLRLQMGDDRMLSTTQLYDAQKEDSISALKHSEGSLSWNEKGGQGEKDCEGLSVVVWDGSLTWTHCSKSGDPKRDVQVWSRENVVTIKISARAGKDGESELPLVKFWYHAEPVSETVGDCEFGEVSVNQFCVSAVNLKLDWESAERFCGKRGGHLLSIQDENSQNVIDSLLLNSPDYREPNSFWIGASDRIYEGHFRWSDGSVFSYSNWFPGWSQHSFYNRQPNDDGFSHQDCVEIRRVFPHPSGSRIVDGVISSYLWNDLDCNATNFFLCERLESGEPSKQFWSQECNKTITLTREQPKAIIVSSGFPHQYPDNVRCETIVLSPAGFKLVVEFEELVLEKEPSCSYDYLELVEFSRNDSYVTRRLCGDMSDKLKLLRYTSQGPRLKFVFVSDYSYHYGGFKARVSIQSVGMECSDDRFQMFNHSCYLFVSYPKVTWDTAKQICIGMKAELASILSAEEESFISGNIRNSLEYTTSSAYWLGGYLDASIGWLWADGASMEYSAWIPNVEAEFSSRSEDALCLAVQWISSGSEKGHPASGLYWTSLQCKKIGGYVCKKGNQISGAKLSLNKTINGTEGHLTSPGYPGPYFHNLDYYVHLVGPAWTRVVVTLTKLDLESQVDCLYDYLELRSGGSEEAEVRWCGSKITRKNKQVESPRRPTFCQQFFNYSVSGMGFYANWKAVDVTGCPLQKLTAREGIISSPNFGDFLLPRLDCTTIILAPPGKRIWLEFIEANFKDTAKDKGTTLELDLGTRTRVFEPFQSEGSLVKGSFISEAEKMVVRLITSSNPGGTGFRAVYRTVSLVQEEEILDLTPESYGVIHHVNYPADPPTKIDFVQHFFAPIGYIIYLELQEVTLSETGKHCPGGSGIIEVTDNYADVNGTWWFLCEVKGESYYPAPPFAVSSYLNSLHVRQKSGSLGVRMNATVKVKPDPNFKVKLLRAPEGGPVESCRPNPCRNGGKCLALDDRKTCQCIGHFTGMFCALTICELEPCLFGQCELTGSGYRCQCQPGYTGHSCDRKQSPCEDNPCEGRGECMEKADSFHCRCHAWWEGTRCEKRMVHIPFKPLSERMLQEPFWLGLITVFVVLAVIGIVWCAKRHFPEKLEKLLAEEADRQSRSNVSGIVRPPSVREHIHATSAAAIVSNPPSTANCPRTLFGRLGIRKSSLLSLTSPQRQDAGTSRTFSLDDLLRPSPRRTPSPRKKSSNSSTTKRNPAEKKQILQQLICPPSSQPCAPKVTLNELITLKETKRKSYPVNKSEWKETSFTVPTIAKADSRTELSKLEKKVTFARLLSKVSAEMSSGSEAETSNPTLKALSTPVSPALERRSTQSISSNQGSDSLSSSEIAISGSTFSCLLDIPDNAKKPARLSYRNAKNASADSILEMFRSFASTSVLCRRGPSVSTTPTTSPQDDREESSALETPGSTTSGPIDSPIVPGTTIEIPVMDALTAQKSFLQPPTILLEIPSGGVNKCLTPIHEVPTPVPSPALTPVMSRAEYDVKNEMETSDEDKDKDGSEVSKVFIQVHRDGYIEKVLTEFEPRANDAPGMIIPLLTVQEPSPPSTSPPGSFPGSPPPQKPTPSFIFCSGESSRRYGKGLEKPNSLDLPYPPPMITVTCNTSEPESDTEQMSPVSNKQALKSTVNCAGMTYLSPFSMCSRADRTASESNLSSSGYSSMASPGPSRCGSNNPLCLLEGEDHQQTQSQPPSRRLSPLLRSPTSENLPKNDPKHLRGRSDSETLSDDPLMESNDEGIGTDHLDEKLEEGEVKSARELEIFLAKEASGQNVMDFGALTIPNVSQRILKKCDNFDCLSTPPQKASLQLPTIVVQSDYCDKLFSPVSSRSESPLSDKALGRFSPMFYGKSKCDHVIFTDSDGLYDFPSSDCPPSKNKSVQAGSNAHRKSTGRRRERRNSHRNTVSGSKNTSPNKTQDGLLDVPQKEVAGHRRKPSPKRRIRTQHPPSSSSSTESLNSGNGELWKEKTLMGSNEASAKGTAEGTYKAGNDFQKDDSLSGKKVMGFRTIAHQIRFLRRIELSLRRKEKVESCLDSEDGGHGDDPSLSLLPQELRKNTIGILHSSSAGKRRGHKKRNVGGLPLRGVPKQDAISAARKQTD